MDLEEGGLDGVCSGQGQVAGACEYGNELSCSIKCGEFLDQLQNQVASQEGLCSMEQVSKYICYEHVLLFCFMYVSPYVSLCSNTQSDPICCDFSGVSHSFGSRKPALEGQQYWEFQEPNLRVCSHTCGKLPQKLRIVSFDRHKILVICLTSGYSTCSCFRNKCYVGKDAVFFLPLFTSIFSAFL